MDWLGGLWEEFTHLIPVERWVRSIGNVLRGLSLAFILLWLLVLTELWSRLAPVFSQQDRIFIAEFPANANYYGWLPKEAWDWISQHR